MGPARFHCATLLDTGMSQYLALRPTSLADAISSDRVKHVAAVYGSGVNSLLPNW